MSSYSDLVDDYDPNKCIPYSQNERLNDEDYYQLLLELQKELLADVYKPTPSTIPGSYWKHSDYQFSSSKRRRKRKSTRKSTRKRKSIRKRRRRSKKKRK